MNWRLDRDADDVAWLHLDRPGSGTNVLSEAVLDELQEALTGLETRLPRALIVLSDKPGGFIAGADIRELKALQSPEQALKLVQHGDEVLNRLEDLPCPTVAMIHGFCLGGGLELALACRYRVAASDGQTRIGLPEVRLGIHPGLGGTWRLPRLIGELPALRLMLAGKVLSARKAMKLGVVDRLAPSRALQRAARDLALRPPPPARPWFWQRVPRTLRRVLLPSLKRRASEKANPAHYPAPNALLELWAGGASDRRRGLSAEAESMTGLLFTPTARSLMRLFALEEKLKAYGKGGASDVRHVHVIGAGTMGAAIAAWCAMKGLTVSLSDNQPEILAKAMRQAAQLFAFKLDAGPERLAAMDRLIPDLDNAGISKADLVLEAIVENIEAKSALFSAIEPRLKAGAILASNTSAIPIESLAAALRDPARLAGLHFFNPVDRVRLIEVVQGRQTAAEIPRRLAAFAVEIERLPLPVRSSPGFLVNRCLLPYLMEAVMMESEGIPAAMIDRAATDFGMPMGPLRLADLVGLEVCLDVARELNPKAVPERLQALVAAHKLGVKSGEGFYRYRDRQVLGGRSDSHQPPEDLTERLILRMVNEAVAVLREGLVEDADAIDAGMVFGAGVAPHLGGPLGYLSGRDKSAVRAIIDRLATVHGDRFEADPGWSMD